MSAICSRMAASQRVKTGVFGMTRTGAISLWDASAEEREITAAFEAGGSVDVAIVGTFDDDHLKTSHMGARGIGSVRR